MKRKEKFFITDLNITNSESSTIEAICLKLTTHKIRGCRRKKGLFDAHWVKERTHALFEVLLPTFVLSESSSIVRGGRV